MQDFLLLRISPAGGGLRGPAFELDEVLVAGGQRSGGDQDAAQMGQRFARGQFVERAVGERAQSCGELGQHGLRSAAGEPGQDGGGPAGSGQRLVQGLQLRADVAGAIGEELAEPLAEMAPAACSGDQPSGAGAGRAALEEVRAGDGAVSAQRCVTRAGTGRGELPAL